MFALSPKHYKRIERATARFTAYCHRLAYHGRGRKYPPILINALPQSGSTFIAKNLRQVLRVGSDRLIVHGFSTIGTIDPLAIERFAKGNAVSQQHLPAEPHIVAALAMMVPRFVLNLRDPRAALVSRTHFIMRHKTEHSTLRAFQAIEQVPPPGYFELPFADQLAWQTEHHLPRMITWIGRWLDVLADPRSGLDVLITDHADLARDSAAFLRRILDFHQIEVDPPWLRPQTPKPGRWKFRAGTTEDWRKAYPPETLIRATDAVPAAWRTRFNWQ